MPNLEGLSRSQRSKKRQEEWPRESSYAPCVLPATDVRSRQRLNSAIEHWLLQSEFAKWPRAMQWFRNEAYFTGNHYANFRFNGQSVDFQTPKHQGRGAEVDRLIPRTVDNCMIRPVEVRTGLMAERRPHPRVTPHSDQPEDEDAALIAQLAFEMMWERELKGPEHVRQLGLILCMQGTGSLETVTEETHDVVTVPMEKLTTVQSPIFPGQQVERFQPTGETEQEGKREIRLRVGNAFELTPDPCATDDPDTLQWIARQSYEDLTWIQEQFDVDAEGYFPEELEKIAPDVGHHSPLYWHERCKDLLDTPDNFYGLSTLPYGNAGVHSPNQTLFTVIDCRPNKYFPHGRTLIHCGGALIYAGDSRAWSEKYPWRWHPHAFFRHWTVPGRWWGMPLLSALVPLQKRINAIDSLASINRQYMTIGQWLIPNQCKVPDGATSGYPGQDIRYQATAQGAKPEKVNHEPLPGELYKEREECKLAIQEISASRILSGSASFGSELRAGIMLDFLRRETLSSMGAALQEFERGMEETAQNVLIEVSLGMGSNPDLAKRIAMAAREHSSLALEAFSGLSLRDHVHVKLDIASELLKSPEAEQEAAQLWLQVRGPNMSPQESALLAKKLGLEGFDRANLPQYERARKMVARIMQGQGQFALPIPQVDEPGIFAEVIRTAMLQDRVYDLPDQAVAQLYKLLQYYLKQIEAQRNAAILEQVKLAQLTGGAAGGPPAGRR